MEPAGHSCHHQEETLRKVQHNLAIELDCHQLAGCFTDIMPFSIVSGIIGEYAFGDTDRIRCFVCQTGALTILLHIVSFHTMALMAVDRFIYL